MNNEPKASMSIDPELLAAYIDKRLSPEQRAAVEAQLAADPDGYGLLVETLRAIDAEAASRPPLATRSPARRGWIVAGGILAAAAALIVFVRTDNRSNADSTAALSAAVRNERPTEARLTGGFRYAPVAPVTRGIGEPASRNLALVAAASELQQRVTTAPTAANRHAWALAQLLTGDLDGATGSLSALVTEDATNAAWHSDLSAVLLARASLGDTAQLVSALDHASEATRLNPQLAEAAYNRALALEKSSLLPEALQEWRRFITLETDAAWRADAEAHIQSIEGMTQSKPSAQLPSTVDQLIAARASDLRAEPARWREVIEGPLMLSAIEAQSAEAISAGLALSASLESATGDALPHLTWSDIARRADARALIDGLNTLHSAAALLKSNDVTRARTEFRRAERALVALRSPASTWATFYVAYCTFYLGETRQALEQFEKLARQSEAARHLTIAMKSLYLVGLGRLRMGQHVAVVEIQRRTALLAQQLGDREGDALARAEIADAMWRLSLSDAGWRERTAVLRLALEADLPNVRHVAFTSAARNAAAENRLGAAASFAQAALDNALTWGNPAAVAEARIRLADVADRRHDAGAALSLLDEAERGLDSLPDNTFTESWRADLEIARGAALLGRSDHDASKASDRAFEILSRRQSPFRLARAHWIRGKALVPTDAAGARAEFREGLQASQAAPGGLDPFGRSLAEQRWLLLRELAALPPDPSTEDGLAPTLSVLLGADAGQTIRALQARLGEDDLILVFLALDRELIRWQISRTKVERVAVPIAFSALTRLVAAHVALMATPASKDWESVNEDLGRRLFEGLDAPLPRRLMLITDATTAPIAVATLKWPGSHSVLAAETDLVIVSTTGAKHQTVHGRALRALVVGAPSTSYERFLPALPGARAEATAVASLYDGATLLLGNDATRTRFLDELSKADVVHFAGHAMGDAADPSASRLLLAGRDGEGDLTAADIVQQPLRARVVVLGSCQGAAGAAAGNVPVQGLARAFLQGGAQAVIAAQWNVDDQFANAFLTALHRYLVAGAVPSSAIRNVQAAMRQDRRFQHPYYWAGFSVYSRLTPQMEPKNET